MFSLARWVRPVEAPPELRAFATRLNGLTLLAIFGWGAFAVRGVILDVRADAIFLPIVVAVLAVLRPIVLRARTEAAMRAGAVVLAAVHALVLTGWTIYNGPVSASPAEYLALLPLAAAYQLDVRAAVWWGGVALVLLVIIHLVLYLLPTPPGLIPEDSEVLFGRALRVVLICGFGVVARRAYDRQITLLADRERTIREQAAAVAAARDDALAAARVKAQFLANMSHEIRTPLAGVISVAGLLRDAGLDVRQAELADIIRDSGETLLAILNDVLDFSKIESGAMVIERAPVEVRTCVESVAALFGPSASAKGIHLRVELDKGAPAYVLGDGTRLRQVLFNLVGNSVKFTPRGEVVVRLGALEGGRLAFSVRDTGIGIEPEARSRLFQAFTQLDESHARRFGGTGLGLSISARLVEKMGGSIEVASEPGRGSTFRFTIATEPAEPPAAPALAPLVALDRELASRHPLSILVAEDNVVNRRVIEHVLSTLGYQPDLVDNGAAAVTAARARDYDVIFMDLQMPELDGVEATRRILHEDGAQRRRPRVLALTASVLPDQRRQCEEAGMEGFIHKPFQVEHIVAALAAVHQSVRGPDVLEDGPLRQLRLLLKEPGKLAELVTQHLQNGSELIAAMKRAHAEGDARALHRAAHSLKSSSAMFGAREVSRRSLRLEELTSDHSLDGTAQAIVAVEEAFGAASERLAAEVGIG